MLQGLRKKRVTLIIITVAGLLLYTPVFAKKTIGDALPQLGTTVAPTGIENTSVEDITGRTVKGILTAVGLVFFILMIYAGVTWMTARGEEEKIEKAQKTIIAATIGIGIVVGSYALTNLVVTRLLNGPSAESPGTATPNINEGPLGCCIDWVGQDASGENYLHANTTEPACRVTTQADCKLQGEAVNDFDNYACPGPAEGCWGWDGAIKDVPACSQRYCGG